MADKGEIKIPVFDGQDYNMWKKRIMLFLKFKECDEVIKREKVSTDKVDWDNKDLKAMNYIYSAISNKQLEFVGDEETAYGIIKKFDEMYLKESTALQIVCRNKLYKIRLEKFSNSELFFNEFEKLINELKSAGAKVNEKEKLNYMLNALPESYSYIGDLIDTLKETDQTVDYVRSKITLVEMKNRKDIEEKNSNAFVANKEGCYKCGKPGHFARECKSGNQTDYSNGSRQGFTHSRGRGGSGRGNYSRGRNRGRSQRSQQGVRRGEYNNEDASAWVATTAKVAQSVETYRVRNYDIEWLLDSGCSDHIINNDTFFESCITLKEPVNIYLGDNRSIKATKIGSVLTYFATFGKQNKVKIKNVYFAEEMNMNLISIGKLTDNNNIVTLKENVAKIFDSNNKMIAIAFKINSTYKMKSKLSKNVNFVNRTNRNNNMSQKERWHRVLGHVNFGYLNTICKRQLLNGVPNELESEFMKCKICIENKMHNLPFENKRNRAKEILEIIHTDVCGPFKTKGFNGEKYFVSFIDDYSKIAKIYCIKSKDEVFDCLVKFINESESIIEKKVKFLRCDNGKEYLNNRINKFAREKGIVLNNCPSYVHELNGTAERFNRTIMDMSRCLLAEAQVHKQYWPEIVCAAAYLKNRTLANTLERKTPFEIFFGKRPNVKNLKLYGSKVFVRVPEQKRFSKWEKS